MVRIEPVISEEFEQYDDEKEFRRLIRAVKFAQKHYLYFVCCNQVPKQNELIAETKKSLKGKPVKVVKFKKPITDILGELQKKTIGGNCDALFVQGLEYSISSDSKGDENRLIHNLNISRDSFKKYLSCPMFLWLPEYALVKITRHAPDFFSVRSGTFYFSNPPEKVAEQIFQNASSNYIESSSLPLAEKLKQIESLESLLAEYRGLHSEKQDKQAEMRLLKKLAEFFFAISKYRKAVEYWEKSLVLSRQTGDRQNEGDNLGNLGNAYRSLGDYQKAKDFYEQSLAIKREIGDRLGEGNSLRNMGNTFHRLGDYERSKDFYEQSLGIYREIGNRWGEGNSLSGLGLIYHSLGEYQRAVDYQEQSLAIKRAIGDRLGEGNSLGGLGLAYNSLGDYFRSINFYEQSLAIKREIGDRLGEGNSLSGLGRTCHSLGETEKACALWKAALIIFETIESPSANTVRRLIEENCID